MRPQLGVLLTEGNEGRQRSPVPEADLVLLERTLFDPPRAAAAGRWQAQIERLFPNAELIPYVWHLISHAVEDGLRAQSSRTLQGEPHLFGQLQATREVEQAWDAAMQAYTALKAKRVVLRTPPSLSPGPVGRKRIESFIQTRREQSLAVVWEPEGLWEPDEAASFADSLGVDFMWRAFSGGRPVRPDGSTDGTLVAPSAWLRVEGMGRRPRLSADQLDALLEHAESVDVQPTLIFSGPKALSNLAMVHAELT